MNQKLRTTLKKHNTTENKFLILSFLLHVLLFLWFHYTPAPAVTPTVTKIEVDYTDPDELAPPEKPKPVKSKKEAVTDQVVEQQKQVNDEKDENTRFLSAHDQKVLQQTRAERSGQFKNNAQGGHKEEGQKDAEKKESEELEKSVKNHEKGDMPDLKDLSPKFALTPGPKGLNVDNSDPSQTDDYLKDVQSGLQTLLSTREFVYYSYYNRIKESLRQHWEPNVREKVKIIYRKGRNIASAKDRVTQVLVTLDAKGELIKVEVITRSGVEALDHAAEEAFKAAAPFPNPPAGMVEADGTIKIRWDFVLEA